MLTGSREQSIGFRKARNLRRTIPVAGAGIHWPVNHLWAFAAPGWRLSRLDPESMVCKTIE